MATIELVDSEFWCLFSEITSKFQITAVEGIESSKKSTSGTFLQNNLENES
jgi:hypothetical protein